MRRFIATSLVILGSLLFLSSASSVLAISIEKLSNTEVRGDFVLGPGKHDLLLGPGDTVRRELIVTNRTGKTMKFKTEIEDFKGSSDPNTTVTLLGSEKGPYSLRDLIKPEVTVFSLRHGERASLPVTISIPKNAEPGGLYGALIIATVPEPASNPDGSLSQAKTELTTISRLASLFFIRIKGDIKESGELKNFTTVKNQHWFETGPISFEISYQNNGSIHLTPNGSVEITNLLGRTVGDIDVEEFFAMPGSLRAREVVWNRGALFGRYTAKLDLARGYRSGTDITDSQSVSFYVIPWKLILVILLVFIAVFSAIKFFFSKFEFKRKDSKK